MEQKDEQNKKSGLTGAVIAIVIFAIVMIVLTATRVIHWG